jgi:hypothetical protein
MFTRIAISFGYSLDPESVIRIPRKGGRRSFDEVVHWNKW